MERNFVFGCVIAFLVFQPELSTTNNHRNGSIDISYLRPLSRDSERPLKILKNYFLSRKSRLKVFILISSK